MHSQFVSRFEAFLADGTLVRSLSCVGQFMSLAMTGRGEILAAYAARVPFFVGVDARMDLDIAFGDESFCTVNAFERTLPTVGTLVHGAATSACE